jgi:hypothetical protein
MNSWRARAILAATALAVAAQTAPRAGDKAVTIRGYVLHSACAFTKNLEKPISLACARECASAGSPLVILAGDGTIYWPLSDSTPASDRTLKSHSSRESGSTRPLRSLPRAASRRLSSLRSQPPVKGGGPQRADARRGKA